MKKFKTSSAGYYLRAPLEVRLPASAGLRVASSALMLAIFAAGVWFAYDYGRGHALGSRSQADNLQQMQEQIAKLTEERDDLARSANTIESKVNIDKSTQKQLADQIKALTAENMKLKDDLALFENLNPSAAGGEGISLQNLKVEVAADNQLRYKVLVMQGGKAGRDFQGELQFNIALVQNGKPVIITLPDAKAAESAKIKLSFRHYQRVEGSLTLPDAVQVKNVQARVIDRGAVRAQHAVNL